MLWNHPHDILAALGMIPALGIVPDLLDAFLYLLEGHGGEAAFSLAAAVPVVGDLGRLGRYGAKAVGEIGELSAKSAVIPKQITVIGSRADTLVAKGWPGHNVLDRLTWSAKENIKWLDSAMRRGDKIYLATDPAKHAAILNSLPTRPYSAFLDLELPYLRWRGYVQEGVYMVPKGR